MMTTRRKCPPNFIWHYFFLAFYLFLICGNAAIRKSFHRALEQREYRRQLSMYKALSSCKHTTQYLSRTSTAQYCWETFTLGYTQGVHSVDNVVCWAGHCIIPCIMYSNASPCIGLAFLWPNQLAKTHITNSSFQPCAMIAAIVGRHFLWLLVEAISWGAFRLGLRVWILSSSGYCHSANNADVSMATQYQEWVKIWEMNHKGSGHPTHVRWHFHCCHRYRRFINAMAITRCATLRMSNADALFFSHHTHCSICAVAKSIIFINLISTAN